MEKIKRKLIRIKVKKIKNRSGEKIGEIMKEKIKERKRDRDKGDRIGGGKE